MKKAIFVFTVFLTLPILCYSQISENFYANGSSVSGFASIDISESIFDEHAITLDMFMGLSYDYYFISNLSVGLYPSMAYSYTDYEPKIGTFSFGAGVGIKYYVLPPNVEITKLVYTVGLIITPNLSSGYSYDAINDVVDREYRFSLTASTNVGFIYFLSKNNAISLTASIRGSQLFDNMKFSMNTFIGYSYFIPRKELINIR
jgi:hypothetical protein